MAEQVSKGNLYLFPSPLGDAAVDDCLPPLNRHILNTLDHFIVEELRTARRFLKKAGYKGKIDDTFFFVLNEHTADEEISNYLEPTQEGKGVGLMSEAGLPCIADPGHKIVALAHRKGIRVVPLTGPSSLMLALMASGFNGQQFTFHGYLPVKPHERTKSLKKLEREARLTGYSQIFIETPYRNLSMLETIVTACAPETRLCIATSLTLPDEFITTMPVSHWKKKVPDIQKKPAVFIIGS
ncbi:MAG TPA: SAM-dependent methyltransferase [Bacteroidales bacterium]|jgi:16S rRNA (cytidine1402-2'-O)-methyltransferase|nr:SAM-dependent methyltransferase [Bacteroidales bacterium]